MPVFPLNKLFINHILRSTYRDMKRLERRTGVSQSSSAHQLSVYITHVISSWLPRLHAAPKILVVMIPQDGLTKTYMTRTEQVTIWPQLSSGIALVWYLGALGIPNFHYTPSYQPLTKTNQSALWANSWTDTWFWHMMFNVIWFREFCGWLSYLEYEQ